MRYITINSAKYQTVEDVLIRRLHLVGRKSPYTVKHNNIDRIINSLEAMPDFIKSSTKYPNGKDGKIIVYTGYFVDNTKGGYLIPKNVIKGGLVTVTLFRDLHIEVCIK